MALLNDDALSFSASSMSGMEEEEDEDTSGHAASSSNSRWNLNASDAALLVKIVKVVQKRNLKGKVGIWTDYVKVRGQASTLQAMQGWGIAGSCTGNSCNSCRKPGEQTVIEHLQSYVIQSLYNDCDAAADCGEKRGVRPSAP